MLHSNVIVVLYVIFIVASRLQEWAERSCNTIARIWASRADAVGQFGRADSPKIPSVHWENRKIPSDVSGCKQTTYDTKWKISKVFACNGRSNL